MVRIARVSVLDVPHHVTQRGNRRQNVFFKEEDKIEYLKILKEQCRHFKLSIWAYCLMDNHIHLVVVPREKESLARGIGETNRLYSRMINFREGWKGYLWQGRFESCPLDEQYLYCAVRYVERNPVRAGLVEKAEQYLWSSARAHVNKYQRDEVLDHFYLLDEISDWRRYLDLSETVEDIEKIRVHSRTGRPTGSVDFIKKLETLTDRVLTKQKPGPKANN